MTSNVDHDQRRQMILEKALELFAEKGYSGVTFRNLAEKCGIARTTIYRYYEDKRQIFSSAIRQLANRVEDDCSEILAREGLGYREKIVEVMRSGLDLIFEHRTLLSEILQYLLQEKREGSHIRHKVRRHTIGIKVLLSHLLREGILKGEFRSHDVQLSALLFYGVFESAILQIAVTDMDDRLLSDRQVEMLLDGIRL